MWYLRKVGGGILAWGLPWGFNGALPVPGDYNRDRALMDLAVYDRATGHWFIRSLGGAQLVIAWFRQWGYNGAIPVPGDFNADGPCDLAVYDPVTAHWYVREIPSERPLCRGVFVDTGTAVGMVTW